MSADTEVVIEIPEDMAKRLGFFLAGVSHVMQSYQIITPAHAIAELRLAVLTVYPDLQILQGDMAALTLISRPGDPMNPLISKLVTSLGTEMPELRRIERPVPADNSKAMVEAEEEPPSKPI